MKKNNRRGGARPGSGMKQGQKKSKKLEGGGFTPVYLDKPTRDTFIRLGDGNLSKGARRAAEIVREIESDVPPISEIIVNIIKEEE